ncbi:MAG: sensor histidine kinase, partial [Kofleriaceae bacterium]
LQERTRALQRNARALRESQARLHAHDLAELRSQFESLHFARELERLAAADRQRDELVAMLGHELRDPLRALRVVDSLLDLARSAAGQLELRREPIELDQLARCAIEECRPLLDQRRHAIELVVGAGPAPTVLGDPPRLVQALAKLIENAARYTPIGGRISVAVRAEGGDAVATVTDNGRGIPSERLPRIFDLFVRDHAATDLAGGIGLGLGLVKRLISLHDGAVRASSRGAGQGSAFEIRIPLAPQELELSGLYVDHGPPTVRMPALQRPQREPEPEPAREPALADAERG